MENFKASVSVSLQTKMHELASAILGNWDRMVNKSECIISPETIGEIEGNYRSGWIPHQDGGFTVGGYYRCDQDSSYHFTEKQTAYMAGQAENCYKSWRMDNDIPDGTDWNNLTDEQKESLFEYETEWFSDEALLQYEIFCEGFSEYTGDEKTVRIRVSVNYKDAPYYREKYAEDIKEVVLPVDEFMAKPIPEILEEFTI